LDGAGDVRLAPMRVCALASDDSGAAWAVPVVDFCFDRYVAAPSTARERFGIPFCTP